jgi:hypothetical protein
LRSPHSAPALVADADDDAVDLGLILDEGLYAVGEDLDVVDGSVPHLDDGNDGRKLPLAYEHDTGVIGPPRTPGRVGREGETCPSCPWTLMRKARSTPPGEIAFRIGGARYGPWHCRGSAT